MHKCFLTTVVFQFVNLNILLSRIDRRNHLWSHEINNSQILDINANINRYLGNTKIILSYTSNFT